ncbi:MAG TPA: hypothetical protein VI197_00375 [Polyangiaceae bacterium]
MTDAPSIRNRGAIAVSLLAVVLAGLLDVTGPGVFIRDAALLQHYASLRATLSTMDQLGLVLASVLTSMFSVRPLAALFGGCYVALMALGVVAGSLASWMLSGLAAVGAALGLCAWVQLIRHALLLPRQLRHAVAVLALAASSLMTVGTAGLLTPLLLAGPPGLALVVSGASAFVVVLSLASLRAPEHRSVPAEHSWLQPALGLLAVSVVVSIAVLVLTDSFVDPHELPADRPWIQALGAVLAELFLLGSCLWVLRRKPETPSLRLMALILATSAVLAPAGALVLNARWGTAPGLVAAFAGGLASVCVTLLMVVAAARAPERFVGAVVGAWFVSGTLTFRISSSLVDDARTSGVFTAGVALVVPCLFGACAWVLMRFSRSANESGG